MPLVVRPAIAQDQPAVRELVFAVLREYGLSPSPETTDADLDDLAGYYAASGGWFAVLTDDGEIVGCVGLRNLGGGVGELRKMYLRPSHRGRGLGKELLRQALGRAREMGLRRVVLETASVLGEAVSLYRKAGFRPHTPEHRCSRCDQAYFLDLTSHEPHEP